MPALLVYNLYAIPQLFFSKRKITGMREDNLTIYFNVLLLLEVAISFKNAVNYFITSNEQY